MQGLGDDRSIKNRWLWQGMERLGIQILNVAEDDIAAAMARLYRETGLVVEGSAATALVPILRGLPDPLAGESERDVVVVLTGRNVDHERWERATRT